jgi:hypothetical protein
VLYFLLDGGGEEKERKEERKKITMRKKGFPRAGHALLCSWSELFGAIKG